MRTRRGLCYPKLHASSTTITLSIHDDNSVQKMKMLKNNNGCGVRVVNGDVDKKRSSFFSPGIENDTFRYDSCSNRCRKRAKVSPELAGGSDFFDSLPDELVVSILCKLSSSATCPSDFINVLITCKRFNSLGLDSLVLSKASPKTFAIKAKNWSESAHRFLKICSDAGNVDACYTLGMIRFYCLQNRGSGASLMAKAAINSHAQALYSLAVIQFNGSGGSKSDKDLRAGVALCARAAFLGHVDALRELGHCLQDGYGVRQNVAEGRRFLVQANARELAAALTCSSPSPCWPTHPPNGNRLVASTTTTTAIGCPLLSDFGFNVPAPEAHPANRFLTEWFSSRAGDIKTELGLRLCSHSGCGRPETRNHEFRRCSVCGAVNYCSRACQALDWKLRHKGDCAPMARWIQVDEDNDNINPGNGVEINAMEIDGDR
ncbi:F-box protein At1g67340-like [Amaranthus tricolor]|uniref:F-box protein At1g67340-like n=1 Tax=Amaranthus tricolor TaxID=29722 RepID=UPI00258CDCDE|nr:F-box protein At1g67340-like [Amaranthus tricolor]